MLNSPEKHFTVYEWHAIQFPQVAMQLVAYRDNVGPKRGINRPVPGRYVRLPRIEQVSELDDGSRRLAERGGQALNNAEK